MESWAPCDFRGTECFTTLVPASADRSWTHFAYCLEPSRFVSERGDKSVGVFFPRRPLPIEPLTSLSPLPLRVGIRSAFAHPFGLVSRFGVADREGVRPFPREEAAKVAVSTCS
jgi:hypothetical protein